MTGLPPKAQWPGKAFNADTDNITDGLRALLQDTRLLETEADESKEVKLWQGTPQSLQVLTSGATALTKVWASLIAALGGGGAIIAAISTFWDRFGSGMEAAVQRSALMVAAGILGSAVVLAIALMVRADVTGRADAQAATYAARAEIAASFMQTLKAVIPAPSAPRYLVKKDDDWLLVNRFSWVNGHAIAHVDGDEVPTTEWSGLVTLPPT